MAKLMLLRWQAAVKDLREARDPLESGFFADQASVDAKIAEMLKTGGAGAASDAAKYLTDLTVSRMEKVVQLYRDLRKKLLTKYSGDIV